MTPRLVTAYFSTAEMQEGRARMEADGDMMLVIWGCYAMRLICGCKVESVVSQKRLLCL